MGERSLQLTNNSIDPPHDSIVDNSLLGQQFRNTRSIDSAKQQNQHLKNDYNLENNSRYPPQSLGNTLLLSQPPSISAVGTPAQPSVNNNNDIRGMYKFLFENDL